MFNYQYLSRSYTIDTISRVLSCFNVLLQILLERLRNENEDKTKTKMTQSFNQYSENETKIWRQNILNQLNSVSSSCLRSHFVISLLLYDSTKDESPPVTK